MITAKTLNGTQVWVTFCEDCGCNTGGYYCRVYPSEDFGNVDEIDDFVIHAEDIDPKADDPLDVACCLAKQYIESLDDY